MSEINKIEQREDQLKKVKKWSSRIERLKKRKPVAMHEYQFCEKYGINREAFNRHKKGRRIPRDAIIDIVEAAFKAEGV